MTHERVGKTDAANSNAKSRLTVDAKTQYFEAIWNYGKRQQVGALMLGPKDIDHRKSVYKQYNIRPETLSKVAVEFVLQREELSRFIIKELDVLLRVGGTFEIIIVDSKSHSSYVRSRDQVKYEFSVSTNGRYVLIEAIKLVDGKILKLIYRKTRPSLPEIDSIDKWTFGIITNGMKNEKVNDLVNSIIRQNIPEYEILICGPYPFANNYRGISLTVLDDIVLHDDIRAPVAAKKNRIIARARFNNLCILHDRFLLPDDWHAKFKEYGNYFDCLCLPTIDKAGNRFNVDWMAFSCPLTQTAKRNRSMRYSSWSPEVIMQGGVLVGKKSLMEKFGLDERLHWEEMEDMQFSKTAYLNGVLFNVDVNNCFYSEAVNHTPSPKGRLAEGLKSWMLWYRGLISNFVKFKIYSDRYNRS